MSNCVVFKSFNGPAECSIYKEEIDTDHPGLAHAVSTVDSTLVHAVHKPCIIPCITREKRRNKPPVCPEDRQEIDLNAPDLFSPQEKKEWLAVFAAKQWKHRKWVCITGVAGAIGGSIASLAGRTALRVSDVFVESLCVKGLVAGGAGWAITVTIASLAVGSMNRGYPAEKKLCRGILGGLVLGSVIGAISAVDTVEETAGFIAAVVGPVWIIARVQPMGILAYATAIGSMSVLCHSVSHTFTGGAMGGFFASLLANQIFKSRAWEPVLTPPEGE